MGSSGVFQMVILPFKRKYRFITSILFFFLVALAYLHLSPVRYRVSLNLTFPGASADFLDTIKSKSFVHKAISQLPFGVSYYAENSPEKEEYGDALPLNVLLNDPGGEKYNKKLFIRPVSSHSYSIEHEDTIQFYEINAPVNQYYGKFRVVRGAAFNSHFASQVIKFNNEYDLYENYYRNLDSKKTAQPNVITLSIITENPLKGEVFLHTLLELYNHDEIHQGSQARKLDSLQLLKTQIALLNAEANKNKVKRTISSPAPSMQQLNTFHVIKQYLKKPVQQFVQIPYVEEVENSKLRYHLDQYNEAELAKQRLLAETTVDDLAVRNIDEQLGILKTDILNGVEVLSDTHSPAVKTEVANRSAKRELQAALTKYNNFSLRYQSSHASTNKARAKVVGNLHGDVVIVQPGALWVCIIALTLGIIIPLLFTFIRILTKSIATRRWFDSQNFVEKVKILIGTKQID